MPEGKSGVQQAIAIAGRDAPTDGYKVLAELFGTSVPFIYNCERKGFFPPQRARQVVDRFPELELKTLVSPDIAALL